MSKRNDGNEGNDDGPHAPAPGQRSVEDIFEAFGDGMGDSRDRVIEEEMTEETEEERQEREERERIEALTAAGVSHVLDTVERQQNIIEELFRAERLERKLKDEDGE